MSDPKPDIRMVALDLDGTLLNHKGKISPRTMAAVTQAIRRGVVVIPATGRGLSGLPLIVAAIPGVRYAMTTNGAAVWDLGEDPPAAVRSRYGEPGDDPVTEPACLFRHPLPAATAMAVYSHLCSLGGELTIFSGGRSIKTADSMRRMQARNAHFLSTEAKQPFGGYATILPSQAALDSWMAAHAGEVEKFCIFFASPAEALAAMPSLAAIPGVEAVQGSPDNLEATAAGVNKGTALLELGEYLGFTRGQILAVGDSENDRSMLEAAGKAAVMANAMPSVRSIGDFVTQNDCDHDGIAELFAALIF